MWIKRFKESGVSGLADRPRSGKPSTYISEQAGGATFLANLHTPDRPFAAWMLDRLVADLGEERGSPMKRSLIGVVALDGAHAGINAVGIQQFDQRQSGIGHNE